MKLNIKEIWCVYYDSITLYAYDNEKEALKKLEKCKKENPFLNWECKRLEDYGFDCFISYSNT